MKKYFLLFILLALPLAFAQEINWDELNGTSPVKQDYMSDTCIAEYNQVFGKDVTIVMKEYCDSMSGSALYLLGISLLILLFQPLVQKKSVFFGGMIKLLGFGLIVLVMIMLYYRM